MRTLIILPLLLTACWDDSRPIAWDRARTVLGPIPLKTQVAYVDSALDRVTFIDLAGDAPVIATTQVGRNAIAAIPSADRHRMFVITRGEEAVHAGEIDQAPLFWNLDPANPGAPAAAYAIGSPFDRVAVSADGNLAIAYFSAAGPDDTGFFRNPNELAVIDLSQPPGDANPVLKTVLDASHPDRDDISIRLDLGGLPVTPEQVVFALDTATAYVRSDNASDVLQILLEPDSTTAGGNDFRPLLAQLGAGGGPTDIAVYDDPNGTRYLLAATPNTGAVVVIEADTGNFRAVPVADPIDRILLFPSGDGVTPHQALLASIGAELHTLHVLDLTHIEDPLVQPSVQDITLDQPVRDVVPVPDRDLAMIVHDSDRTVLGLLDMSTASTSPLLGVGKLDSYDFTPDGSHLIGATAGISRLGFVALDNLHPTDFRLDDPPVTVLATENGKIFVDHGDPLGHATVIPSATATRDDATVLTGFLTADLLDKEP